MISKEKIELALKDSWNMTELAINLGYENPGTNTKRMLKKTMDRYEIDYSNLKKTARPKYKHKRVLKSCPVCSKKFQTSIGSTDEKTTCSYSCSNTFFRSGSNNPNYKDGTRADYRTTALACKEPECERCGWNIEVSILEVHHIDRDRSNNSIENLELLCQNCHSLDHFYAGDGKFWNNSKKL